MFPFRLVLFLPLILTVLDFLAYLFKGKRLLSPGFTLLLELVTVMGLPLLFLILSESGSTNDCCGESAAFSPEHRPVFLLLITVCAFNFFFASHREKTAPPLTELIFNVLLLLGIILNIFIGYHVESYLGLIGNLPIGLLFTLTLMENQKLLIDSMTSEKVENESLFVSIARSILALNPLKKYPLLVLLLLPILTLLSGILLIFGQKPDALIRVFTDTYKHGFSQLDYLCANVECGGHYLCSVAAKGHKKVVRPQRLGMRNGNLIICNRQLLISNAFEELIQEKRPDAHRLIRCNYNKVGNVIHQYYYLFDNKYLSDIVYLLMKPLEWCFLIALYLFDHKPENRISKQYLQ